MTEHLAQGQGAPPKDQKRLCVFIAPAISLLSLCGIAYLVIQNLSGLVGGSTSLTAALLVMFAAAFGAGVVLAFRRPDLTLD